MMIKSNITVADAYARLQQEIQTDISYAWAWHSNICMGIYDQGGVDIEIATKASYQIMKLLFDVDVVIPSSTKEDIKSEEVINIPKPPLDNPKLLDELSSVINKYNIEGENDTPDFILAQYLINCIKSYNNIIQSRDSWYNTTEIKTRSLKVNLNTATELVEPELNTATKLNYKIIELKEPPV